MEKKMIFPEKGVYCPESARKGLTMKNSRISEKILWNAYALLLDWERTRGNLDEALDRMRAEGVEGRSAVASLLFEYFRHKAWIDRLVADRARKGAVKPELRALLVCALTQCLFQTGIAPESAANVAVDCARRKFGKGPAAFSNAVLRSVLRSPEAAEPPERSFPEPLRQHWEEIFGVPTAAELIAAYASDPPPVFRARGPLPEGMSKEYPGPIYRVLPDRRIYSGNGNVRHLTPEPESAFGIALKSNRGKRSKTVYVRTLRVYDASGKAFNVFLNDAEVIRPSAVRRHKGKYKLHFCGRTRLYPQSLIALGVLDKLGRAQVGQCWDPKNPKAEYDVYVSLKLDKNGDFWISEVVLCGTGRDCPEQKSEEVPANG